MHRGLRHALGLAEARFHVILAAKPMRNIVCVAYLPCAEPLESRYPAPQVFRRSRRRFGRSGAALLHVFAENP